MPFKNSSSVQEIQFISTNKVLGSIIDSVVREAVESPLLPHHRQKCCYNNLTLAGDIDCGEGLPKTRITQRKFREIKHFDTRIQ